MTDDCLVYMTPGDVPLRAPDAEVRRALHRFDQSDIFSRAVSDRTNAGMRLTMARKALLDALAPEALALNDDGLPGAREAAETFLRAERHFDAACNIVRALSAYMKAPPAEPSEPHTIGDANAELWSVSRGRAAGSRAGGVARWLSTPEEARQLAARFTEQGSVRERREVAIAYFAAGASARDGIDIDPGPFGWEDLTDAAMRPLR